MARTKTTANPPPSSRNPPSQAPNLPRASGAPTSQAERPATSRPNLAQETPPVAGGASIPTPDYKRLYPYANSTLLKETSSVNSALAVLRLKKGDQPNLSFHKEHDDKLMVLPCSPDVPIYLMLGKGKLAELRALARTHKLASGSQTVPNSVVEIAAAQGRSPPQGPAPPEALPAPQRKKLVLKKPKRKTPQVVQEDEDEDDEATEDGLITKRRRVAPSSPPAPPAPPALPTPTPPSPPAPTPPVQAVPLAAALPAVEANEPNFMENPPSASTPFVSAGEGPPSTTSIAEATPDAAKVENLEKRLVDREVLLGKVEKERDDAVAELAKVREENAKIAAELAQVREENKKVAEDLAQTRRETEELKKRADELKQ
ncbi:uncharacterized protein [Phaseolus vulgaris]|uniref:uncharacterized protein n=1 Tax=Phaseolus vulgaris TaxID=3885 RepID=UPI0035CACF82